MQIAVAEAPLLGQERIVHPHAVLRAEVADDDAVPPPDDLGVLARDLLGGELQVAGLGPADEVAAVGHLEAERRPRPARRSRSTSVGVADLGEAANRSLTRRRAMVAVPSAPSTAADGAVEDEGDLTERDLRARGQTARLRSAVSRSPSRRVPLVLPRSSICQPRPSARTSRACSAESAR